MLKTIPPPQFLVKIYSQSISRRNQPSAKKNNSRKSEKPALPAIPFPVQSLHSYFPLPPLPSVICLPFSCLSGKELFAKIRVNWCNSWLSFFPSPFPSEQSEVLSEVPIYRERAGIAFFLFTLHASRDTLHSPQPSEVPARRD